MEAKNECEALRAREFFFFFREREKERMGFLHWGEKERERREEMK